MLNVIAALILSANVDPPPIRIDLDSDGARQIVVDREPGVYLGHVSTVLLPDQRTILAAYPKGHGAGPIVLKRSDDGGLTWSARLPTPASWETSRETPTLFRLDGDSVILFSGLYPIRAARSDDLGTTWTELSPIGEFGGIVAMGGVVRRGPGRYAAFFHDDGRFIASGGKAASTFTLYQTDSADNGASWTAPRPLWTGSEIHLCEPGVVASPDGSTLALLLRENRRAKNSHVMVSDDRAATWSAPRELPAELTGDRHIAAYARDGRVVVTFRCMAEDDPWRGDWVAWVGAWSDLERFARLTPSPTAASPVPPNTSTERPDRDEAAAPTRYLVRLKDNRTDWDCGYAGLESLPDGTLVATTYGSWITGESPFILCVRFTLAELDHLAASGGRR